MYKTIVGIEGMACGMCEEHICSTMDKQMYKTIVGIEGMACGMCEEHICSTIKKAFEVNKVKASRSKKCAEIITELPLDEKAVRDAIAPTGYEVTSFACVEEAPKKGFFAKLFG